MIDASNIVHTTKNEGDHNLWGVYQQSRKASRGRVYYQRGYLKRFSTSLKEKKKEEEKKLH